MTPPCMKRYYVMDRDDHDDDHDDDCDDGHCLLQLGVWGCCKPPVGPGQSPAGLQGKAPRSSEESAI